jgi:hypothetical protein
LGLFLLFASQPDFFAASSAPDWVQMWLNARQRRAESSTRKEDKPVDAAAQEKRIQAREAKVSAGMDELRRWLQDLIRQGLADDRVKTYDFWDRMASRMVDAQANGIARWLRDLAGVPFQGRSDWVGQLLDEIGRLYLLADSYQRLESFPTDIQADIRTRVGWNLKQEDLATEPGLRDEWVVLAVIFETEEKLNTRRTWIYGQHTGKTALILDFAFGSASFDQGYSRGQVMDAELVFYPSAYPQRALLKQQFRTTRLDGLATGCDSIEEALKGYAEALGKSPWIERFPMGLRAVTPILLEGHYYLYDAAQQALPVTGASHPWLLLAVSGGHPIPVFGEWDGYQFWPLTVYVDGLIHAVQERAS